MRKSGLAIVVALLAASAACSSGGSNGAAPKASSPAAASASAASLTVTSTIADGAVLTQAVAWEAKPVVSGSDTVSQVEFSIDGKVRWTEKTEPYFFDDDGNVLAPWLLGNGAHVLAVHAVAGSGAEGTATSHVTVRSDTTANAGIAGSYHRTVTSADAQRVSTYRTADKGAFGDVPPTGEWTIKVLATGRIEGHDPVDATVLFEEPFTLSGDHLRIYGPAVWMQPDPTTPDLFCEPEQPSDYVWHVSGKTLTISPVEKVCADRDMVLVGSWTKA